MRPSLRLYCCPTLGCPKVGRAGESCPRHRRLLEGAIYDLRDIQSSGKAAPEAEVGDVVEKVVDVAAKIHRAFSKKT